MTTLSPGFVTVIMAAIMASVEPQVTTMFWLGLIGMPIKCSCLAASASRMAWEPQVMEYWW